MALRGSARRGTMHRTVHIHNDSQSFLPFSFLLLHQVALDTSQILRCCLNEVFRFGRVLQRLKHLPNLGFGVNVRTDPAGSVMCKPAQPAVLGTGELKSTGTTWVLKLAGRAGRCCVGDV